MKFGKYLLDQGVPAWADSYLNYKLLKVGIKRVVAAQKVKHRLPGPRRPAWALLLTLAYVAVAPLSAATAAWTRRRREQGATTRPGGAAAGNAGAGGGRV